MLNNVINYFDIVDELIEPRFKIDSLLAIINSLGFEFYSYCMLKHRSVGEYDYEYMCNYPKEWVSKYKARNYQIIDPIIQHCVKSTLPLVWSSADQAEIQEYWTGANTHNLSYGWSHAVHDHRGVVGIASFSRSKMPISNEELNYKSPHLLWLTHVLHTDYMSQLDSPDGSSEIYLTKREREVLGWTADGKTSSEIATALFLSERTVNFHLKNITSKLTSPNKTAAAAKAVLLKII